MNPDTAKLLNEIRVLRNNIDQIDREIVTKLDDRLKVIKLITKIKKELNFPSTNTGREVEVLSNVVERSDEFDSDEISTIFKVIIEQGKIAIKRV